MKWLNFFLILVLTGFMCYNNSTITKKLEKKIDHVSSANYLRFDNREYMVYGLEDAGYVKDIYPVYYAAYMDIEDYGALEDETRIGVQIYFEDMERLARIKQQIEDLTNGK